MQLTFNIFSIVFLGLLGFVGILYSSVFDSSSAARAEPVGGSDDTAPPPEQMGRAEGKAEKAWACAPTIPDSLGPFYEPFAPIRSSVDTGYVISGEVKSASDCSPIKGARIELWLAGLSGQYDAAHRATIFSNGAGQYRFESNFPPPYGNRPSHIHVRVTAEGYMPLVTQHYPEAGQKEAKFDLVLAPLA